MDLQARFKAQFLIVDGIWIDQGYSPIVVNFGKKPVTLYLNYNIYIRGLLKKRKIAPTRFELASENAKFSMLDHYTTGL